MNDPMIRMFFFVTALLLLADPQLPAQTPPPAPRPAAATPSPSPTPAAPNPAALTLREISGIHAKIPLPKEWTLLEGNLMDGGVVLATRETISSENDPYTTGLSLTVDKTGAKESDQKASAYARSLADAAREKAGEEASPITESQSGPFHEMRFDFPLESDQPLLVTEVLCANDATGTVTTIVWQMPKEEGAKLKDLRDAILAGLILDPTQ